VVGSARSLGVAWNVQQVERRTGRIGGAVSSEARQLDCTGLNEEVVVRLRGME